MTGDNIRQSIMQEVLQIKLIIDPSLIERQKSGTLTEDDKDYLEFQLADLGQYGGLLAENFRRARPESARLMEQHGLMIETFRWLGTLLMWRVMQIEHQLLSNPDYLNEPTNPPMSDHMRNIYRIEHARMQAEEMVLPMFLLEEMPDGVPEPELMGVMETIRMKQDAAARQD